MPIKEMIAEGIIKPSHILDQCNTAYPLSIDFTRHNVICLKLFVYDVLCPSITAICNIILIGASRCGKTWFSCAFGINTCRVRIKMRYIRLPELEAKRLQGQFRQYLQQFQKYDLLILDEFLLVAANPTERNNLLELMESRTNRRSTICCTQWTPERWHERLGAGPVADAILDRIVNSSYTIELYGNSIREDYYSKLRKDK